MNGSRLPIALCLAAAFLLAGWVTFHPRSPVVRHVCAPPLQRRAVVVNIEGDIVSDVMTHEQAVRETERHNSGYFKNENPAGRPFGWRDVVVLDAIAYDTACAAITAGVR